MTDQPDVRPSSSEVAALLREHRQMLAAADGVVSQISAEHRDAWLARKRDLLARIEASTAHRGEGSGRGWSR